MEYEDFQRQLLACRFCKDRGLPIEPRPIVWGERGAKIVQISQAPSRSAGESGRPFSKSK